VIALLVLFAKPDTFNSTTTQDEATLEVDLTLPPVKIHPLEETRTALKCLNDHGVLHAKNDDIGLTHLICMDSDAPEKTVYELLVRSLKDGNYSLRGAFKAGDGTLRSALNAISGNRFTKVKIPKFLIKFK
jgi:hypothetical protein